MITPGDIEFMKQARADAMAGRQRTVVLNSRTMTGVDPYTKQPKYIDVEHSVMAVVTEISGTSGVAIERKMENGMVVIDGDITFSVPIELLAKATDDYITATYGGTEYMILAADAKGIGERNRIEFLGRVVK